MKNIQSMSQEYGSLIEAWYRNNTAKIYISPYFIDELIGKALK